MVPTDAFNQTSSPRAGNIKNVFAWSWHRPLRNTTAHRCSWVIWPYLEGERERERDVCSVIASQSCLFPGRQPPLVLWKPWRSLALLLWVLHLFCDVCWHFQCLSGCHQDTDCAVRDAGHRGESNFGPHSSPASEFWPFPAPTSQPQIVHLWLNCTQHFIMFLFLLSHLKHSAVTSHCRQLLRWCFMFMLLGCLMSCLCPTWCSPWLLIVPWG